MEFTESIQQKVGARSVTQKVLVLLIFPGFLSTVGNAQQSPISMAVETSAGAQAQTQTPPSPPVDLDDLVGQALKKNPGVQSALRQVEALRHRVPQAKTFIS